MVVERSEQMRQLMVADEQCSRTNLPTPRSLCVPEGERSESQATEWGESAQRRYADPSNGRLASWRNKKFLERIVIRLSIHSSIILI